MYWCLCVRARAHVCNVYLRVNVCVCVYGKTYGRQHTERKIWTERHVDTQTDRQTDGDIKIGEWLYGLMYGCMNLYKD